MQYFFCYFAINTCSPEIYTKLSIMTITHLWSSSISSHTGGILWLFCAGHFLLVKYYDQVPITVFATLTLTGVNLIQLCAFRVTPVPLALKPMLGINVPPVAPMSIMPTI